MGELLVFAAYQLAFVLGPGVMAFRALARRPGGALRQICVGGALGHALELAAFMASAGAGARGAFLAYPVLTLVLAGPAAWRRRRAEPFAARGFSPGQAWALATVVLCVLGLYGAGAVSQVPLPGREASVSYYPDLVWGMSLAAEARHHWPMTTPQVSGEPLRYHSFVFVHMAAVDQVTGIELAAVALRLVPLALLLLFALQLAYAGRHLTGRAWAGPLAAGALLLVGDLDLGAGRPEPLLGSFFSGIFLSPTHLLGLVMFVPAVVVIRDLLDRDGEAAGRGDVVVLGFLLFACGGAKGSVLPVLLGGLALFALWGLRRGIPRITLAVPLGLVALAFAASYLVLYRGSGNVGLEVDPLETAVRTLPGSHFAGMAHDGPLGAVVAYPVATFVTLLCLMPVLAGLVWLAWRGRRATSTEAWLLALLAAAVAAFLLLDLPGLAQYYFLWYGYVAGAFVAVAGLVAGWDAWTARGRPALPLAALVAAAGAALVLGLDLDVEVVGLPLSVAYVALAIVVGAILAACAAGLLDASGRHAAPALLVVAALLAAATLDGPLDRLPQLARRALDQDRAVHRTADPVRERGLTLELNRGLGWLRDHTDSSSVLAVNNHLLVPAGRDSRYFYYSALSERRVYLESWDYTDEAARIGVERVRTGLQPYPRRLSVNDAAFSDPSEARLSALRRAGVTHLVVDRLHGPVPRPGAALGRPAYESSALVIYPLD